MDEKSYKYEPQIRKFILSTNNDNEFALLGDLQSLK
jgi:hypothetical protein